MVSMTEIERAASDGRRTPLFFWMHLNHEEFTRVLAKVGRPNWAALSRIFADAELLPKAADARAEKMNGEVARQTWRRVRIVLGQEKRDASSPKSAAQPRDGFSPVAANPMDALYRDDDFAELDKI